LSDQSYRWLDDPYWYLWEGGFLLIGRGQGVVPPHQHHAIQIVIAIEGLLAICGEDPSSPKSMTDLADRLVHSKSGLTYQVGQLAKAGLVERVPSPRDVGPLRSGPSAQASSTAW